MDAEEVINSLAHQLFNSQNCSSLDEARCVVESIIEDVSVDNLDNEKLILALMDYFSLSTDEAREVVELAMHGEKQEETVVEPEYEIFNHDEADDLLEDEEETNEFIGEGECELCERFIRLTRHHLIPRSTWPRIKTKLLQVSEAVSSNDTDRATSILCANGLEHFSNEFSNTCNVKECIRLILQRTCDICRPCHNAVHGAHDNLTLALHYNTIDKLLEDKQIYKFCKWASKQRTGKYSR